MPESILYREEDNKIFVRAIGRVTANICYEFRKRVFSRLNAAPPVKDLYIDLSQCDYMDSTFMGIILGINKKMKLSNRTGVTVVCPTDECHALFDGLNILQFLSVHDRYVVFPGDMEVISYFQKPNPEIVLFAHEDLIEASDSNAPKFRLLKDILKKKVEDEGQTEPEKDESGESGTD